MVRSFKFSQHDSPLKTVPNALEIELFDSTELSSGKKDSKKHEFLGKISLQRDTLYRALECPIDRSFDLQKRSKRSHVSGLILSKTANKSDRHFAYSCWTPSLFSFEQIGGQTKSILCHSQEMP